MVHENAAHSSLDELGVDALQRGRLSRIFGVAIDLCESKGDHLRRDMVAIYNQINLLFATNLHRPISIYP